MQNIQHRVIDAPAHRIGAIVDELDSSEGSIWPSADWPRLSLDAGLAPGSRGGHGVIRYSVTEYEPGRRIRFTFAPGLGLAGYHELVITPEGPDQCRLTHTIEGTVTGRMWLLWPLVIRWLHEALTQDLFDNAERAANGQLSRPSARWSPWVRMLRRARGLSPARATSDAAPAAVR